MRQWRPDEHDPVGTLICYLAVRLRANGLLRKWVGITLNSWRIATLSIVQRHRQNYNTQQIAIPMDTGYGAGDGAAVAGTKTSTSWRGTVVMAVVSNVTK